MRSPPTQTPTAPGLQPLPCAFHTACRMHLRTPSSVRSARPRCGSSTGSAYCALVFSQPPPLRISLISISSRSHWSKWMIGVPGPRLSPEFLPVIESTELGRSLPRRVASATASRICCAHPDLVGADRHVDLEGRHAGVLADRAFVVDGEVDVLGDDRQRLRRAGALRLGRLARASSPRARRAAGRSRCGRSAAGRCRKMMEAWDPGSRSVRL